MEDPIVVIKHAKITAIRTDLPLGTDPALLNLDDCLHHSIHGVDNTTLHPCRSGQIDYWAGRRATACSSTGKR